jgi:hypothetical protein
MTIKNVSPELEALDLAMLEAVQGGATSIVPVNEGSTCDAACPGTCASSCDGDAGDGSCGDGGGSGDGGGDGGGD